MRGTREEKKRKKTKNDTDWEIRGWVTVWGNTGRGRAVAGWERRASWRTPTSPLPWQIIPTSHTSIISPEPVLTIATAAHSASPPTQNYNRPHKTFNSTWTRHLDLKWLLWGLKVQLWHVDDSKTNANINCKTRLILKHLFWSISSCAEISYTHCRFTRVGTFGAPRIWLPGSPLANSVQPSVVVFYILWYEVTEKPPNF